MEKQERLLHFYFYYKEGFDRNKCVCSVYHFFLIVGMEYLLDQFIHGGPVNYLYINWWSKGSSLYSAITIYYRFYRNVFGGLYGRTHVTAKCGLFDALHVSGKLGRLNVITTGIEEGKFNWGDKYNIWSGIIGGFFLALAYFGADQSR